MITTHFTSRTTSSLRNSFCAFPTSSNKERLLKVVKETMVWFVCDDCGDSIKKPALKKHFNNCSASRLSCVDCGAEFDRYCGAITHEVRDRTREVRARGDQAGREGERCFRRFNQGGGDARTSCSRSSNSSRAGEEKEKIVGREYLATEAPWMCSCCNVECTGAETLKSHALGKKHKRKAKTLRTQKEEENKANDEGKPKSMSP